MIVAVPQQTFRVSDNPLHEYSEVTLVHLTKKPSPHQHYLFLQTLMHYRNQLAEKNHRLIVLKCSKPQFSTAQRQLLKKHTLITDRTFDPDFVKPLSETSVTTNTLVDWMTPENSQFLQQYWSTARPYSKLTKVKEHALKSMRRLVHYPVKATPSSFQFTSPFDVTDTLEALLSAQETLMRGKKLVIHDHLPILQSLEQWTKERIALISDKNWTKPSSLIAFDYGEATPSMKNAVSSQLSPLFSIGALGVREAWEAFPSTSPTTMGSGKDQLLFREAYYSVAEAHAQGVPGRVQGFWTTTADDFAMNHTVDWVKDTKELKKWQDGKLENAADANEAMHLLVKTGWIHHLRRHVVADVLTRGRLKHHWVEGEAFFRKTLLDHDAVLNRCNWMWLSATAFSSKQKLYHYNPNDYVKRHDKKHFPRR